MNSHPIGVDRKLTGITNAQHAVYERIRTGPRGAVPSPFLAMLDSPLLADNIQQVGVTLRFGGSLSDADRELAILTTAAVVNCNYEWQYHEPIAVLSGLAPEAIAATRSGIPMALNDRRWARLILFCTSIVESRRVDPLLLNEVIGIVGREGATELIAICGYYALLASFIIIGGHDT